MLLCQGQIQQQCSHLGRGRQSLLQDGRDQRMRKVLLNTATSTTTMLIIFLLLLLLSSQQVHLVQAASLEVGNGLNDSGSMRQITFDVPPATNDIVYYVGRIDSTLGGGIELGPLTWQTPLTKDGADQVTRTGSVDPTVDIAIFRLPDGTGDDEAVDCTAQDDFCIDDWPDLVGIGGRYDKANDDVSWCCSNFLKTKQVCDSKNDLIIDLDIFNGYTAQIHVPQVGFDTLNLPENEDFYTVDEGGVYVIVMTNCNQKISQNVHVEGFLGWMEAGPNGADEATTETSEDTLLIDTTKTMKTKTKGGDLPSGTIAPTWSPTVEDSTTGSLSSSTIAPTWSPTVEDSTTGSLSSSTIAPTWSPTVEDSTTGSLSSSTIAPTWSPTVEDSTTGSSSSSTIAPTSSPTTEDSTTESSSSGDGFGKPPSTLKTSSAMVTKPKLTHHAITPAPSIPVGPPTGIGKHAFPQSTGPPPAPSQPVLARPRPPGVNGPTSPPTTSPTIFPTTAVEDSSSTVNGQTSQPTTGPTMFPTTAVEASSSTVSKQTSPPTTAPTMSPTTAAEDSSSTPIPTASEKQTPTTFKDKHPDRDPEPLNDDNDGTDDWEFGGEVAQEDSITIDDLVPFLLSSFYGYPLWQWGVALLGVIVLLAWLICCCCCCCCRNNHRHQRLATEENFEDMERMPVS